MFCSAQLLCAVALKQDARENESLHIDHARPFSIADYSAAPERLLAVLQHHSLYFCGNCQEDTGNTKFIAVWGAAPLCFVTTCIA